ncbi:MAG: MBL fold metallo-hydrolase [Bacteroidetes bacterium]|nr:MAG: MBL fold metallo-hydrolase [Bacteroidota bacterium]
MIHTIDLHFQGLAENIATFLVETPGGPILVETGPHSTLAQLQAGIVAAGYQAEAIRHVFLSHIHLDHAGAAWWFAQQGAQVYVHPKGARHLASPERLMESARRIYQDKMDELWGEMHPIPAAQITETAHQQAIELGDNKAMIAHHTPGHAVHHIAWQWQDVLFTGDVAGVRIHGGLVIPPCPPPDIQLTDWKNSIQLIKTLAPRTLYLTHFGPYEYTLSHMEELEQRLDKWADWMHPYFVEGASVAEVTPKFQRMVRAEMEASGLSASEIAQYEAANPAWMSVAGLLRYWKVNVTT